MKDFFFATDLMTVFHHDRYYGLPKNLSVALRKFDLPSIEQRDNIDRMIHTLVVHIMDLRGESEPFLTGAYIYPEALVKLLNEHGLPAPETLQSAKIKTKDSTESTGHAQFEQYFEIVCRNRGTVTDPLATTFRSPIGRLIFRTFLATRLNLGINTTAKYVLDHLKDFDAEQIVTSVNADFVTWRTDDTKEKLTSIETIAKFILIFNHDLKTLLRLP
jgi:hypothetical protein